MPKPTAPDLKFNVISVTRRANPSDIGFDPAKAQTMQVAAYPCPPVTRWECNQGACLTIYAGDKPIALHHPGTWEFVGKAWAEPQQTKLAEVEQMPEPTPQG